MAPTVETDETKAIVTRAQLIRAIEELQAFFDDIVDALEGAQSMFATAPINEQYFGMLDTYADASNTMHLAIQHLLNSTLKLSVERKFTLDRYRAPIEITVTEYGSLGPDDSYLDLFIRSNDLHGKDIILLPPGRQVVIYG
jgi:hypothetical protein